MTFHPSLQFLVLFPLVILSVTLHEFSHGWVANRCGDPTAKWSGRLTLNPLAHMDLWGTFLIPILFYLAFHILFGWAKPVPVNFANLRKPRPHMIGVAAAGPLANILLALFLAVLFHTGDFPPDSLPGAFLVGGSFLNLFLAVFNLIPLPPLDGSRVVMGILPPSLLPSYLKLERFGLLIILLLWASGLLWNLALPVVFVLARGLGLPL